VTSLEKALRDLAQFAAKLKGDEKSEAQTFLFHLLAAFGHSPNTLPESSTFEHAMACQPKGRRSAFSNRARHALTGEYLGDVPGFGCRQATSEPSTLSILRKALGCGGACVVESQPLFHTQVTRQQV